MAKKILVTGGSGFMGSHLVDYLVKQGHNVTSLDNLSGSTRNFVNPNARFVEGSINDESLVEEIMKGKDVVYHLAAYAAEGLSHFIRSFNYRNNLIGSMNLINSAIRNDVQSFLFTSSMAVYGSGEPPFSEEDPPMPEDPYGISKFSVELDLKCAHELFGIDYTIIRPHNVYGERQFLGDPYRNVICIFMNRIMQGKAPLIYGDGEQTRAFSYIGDVTPCIANAPFNDAAKNQIFNVGAGPDKACSVKDLAYKVLKVMGSDLEPEFVEERYEVKHAYSTDEKSKKILGYEDKISLDEGLERMGIWTKSMGPMDPLVWGGYDIVKKLPEFWKVLAKDYPNAARRINAGGSFYET